MLAFLGLIS